MYAQPTVMCSYDGGDCCGPCPNTDLCENCICFDEGSHNNIVNALVGDGFCNDETNNPKCNYDGGDCCGSCVVNDKCSDCTCLDNMNIQGASNHLLGDGVCNVQTNNNECSYDFGDCCPALKLVANGFCNDETNK